MDLQKIEDIRDAAIKLDEIYIKCPKDFFFLKGWIHCLLQKDNTIHQRSSKSSKID